MKISGTPLVLRRFQIDETGTSGANVWIEARQAGVISFLLTLVGLDPNSSLTVTRGSIAFRNSSVFGSSQVSTPLANIGAFVGGYKKPFFALVIGLIFILSGLVYIFNDEGGVGIFCLIIAIGCVLYYYLRKTMYMAFETSGGGVHGFAFRASVIEGVGVDIKRVESTITYVNSLISSASLGENFVEQNRPQVLGGREATMLATAPAAQATIAVQTPVVAQQPVAAPQPVATQPPAPQPVAAQPLAPQPAAPQPAAPQPAPVPQTESPDPSPWPPV